MALGCGKRTPTQPPQPPPASVATTEVQAGVIPGDPSTGKTADAADSNADESPGKPPTPLRLIVLLSGGPLLVDANLTVDGGPHDRGLASLVGLVMTAGDTDEDGVPTWDELIANTPFLYGPLVGEANTLRQNSQQWKQTYDVDRNGFLSEPEARAWLGRDAGRAARSLTLESSRELFYQPRRHSRVWALLDRDEDGALDGTEIDAASARLLTRDADDNRLLYLHELESLRDQLRAADGNMAMTRQRTTDRRAALLLADGEDWQLTAAALADIYASGRTITADAFPQRPELFAAVDVDQSGRLATAELAQLASLPADLRIDVAFGKTDSAADSADSTCRIALADSPPPIAQVLAATGTRLALRIADQHVVFSVHDLAPIVDVQQVAAERLAALDKDGSGYLDQSEWEGEGEAAEQQFAARDANKDGMLIAEEIAISLRLENAVAGSQTQIFVHDQGDAVFERLDADHDGRLGEREIAEATERLQSLDANDDGRLTASEIAGQMAVMFLRGPRSQNQDLSQLTALASFVPAGNRAGPTWFVRGDSNGDGQISRREFLGTPEQFQALDDDADGWITAREAHSASP